MYDEMNALGNGERNMELLVRVRRAAGGEWNRVDMCLASCMMRVGMHYTTEWQFGLHS